MKVISAPRGMSCLVFDCYPERMAAMVDAYCDNPSCDCRQAILTLELIKLWPRSARSKRDQWIRFSLAFDTWQVSNVEVGGIDKPKADEIIEEFKACLTDEMKVSFIERYEGIKYTFEIDESFDMPPDEIRSGACVSLNEVCRKERRDEIKGFRFQYEGKDYILIDHHCINPSCRCDECYISFHVFEEGKQGIKELKEQFLALCSFKKGFRVQETSAVTRQQAEKVLDAWVHEVRGIKGTLKERRKKIKEAGRMVLARHSEGRPATYSATPKPSRNAPCPCGSGKKYKKCCGKKR